MRASRSVRTSRSGSRTRRSSRRRAQPVALFAIVDGGRIPPRCFGEPLMRVAASGRRSAKAYETLRETLSRNGQVGITAVDVDGEPQLAALVPIGRLLAVSPLEPQYTRALAERLRTGAGSPRARRSTQHPRAA